ncbi:hypothetical protein [Streptomyces fragilis]|uniref:Uncharacterized protein n=1 Tax=Streptomyces fragilis TaxID=67301 RepID=A0ABV2YM51_9ACTN|nr:hypothetical protein [Streptomyces fragilis]
MISKTNTTGISTTRAFSTVALENDHLVASLCALDAFDRGTGVSASVLSGSDVTGLGFGLVGGGLAEGGLLLGATVFGAPVFGSRSESAFAGISVREERPTKALEAGVAKAQAFGYAAAGAGKPQQTMNHPQTMWALRGPEPWSDPA